MLNRRDVIKSGAAAVAVAAAVSGAAAQSAASPEVYIDPDNLTLQQKDMLSIRFDSLDGESHQDFVSGFKRFMVRQAAMPESLARTEAHLRSKGLSSLDDTDLDYETCWNLMMEDPQFAVNMRLDTTGQHVMWDRARRAFHKNAAHYLKLLDDAEKRGPGKLEMNPQLVYPDYATHEIHAEPGGYVGDPLGGWVYHYAVTLGYRAGAADHDENHLRYAMGHVKPADGIVRRTLDLGCGTGQSTTPMKMRFPQAEVWGLDVGGPLVRYAHYRALKMGLEVNFRHGLAEDTKFPDNHFDMTSSTILFHEVSAAAARDIVKEIYRVTRPGGTYTHSDTITRGHPTKKPASTVVAKAGHWKQHRHHSYEPWWLEYTDSNFPKVLADAGFQVDLTQKPIGGRMRWIATKPV